MEFTTEKLSKEIIEQVIELTEIHYKEVAPYDDIPLNVNWARLLELDEGGALKCFLMKKENKIIGYATFIVTMSIEYQDSLQAYMQNIFIHPDYRGKGMRFIKFCDEQLKYLGVQVVYHHVKSRNDYGVLLKRMGYEIMNVEYSRRLDKE